jgi:hypothetical protein
MTTTKRDDNNKAANLWDAIENTVLYMYCTVLRETGFPSNAGTTKFRPHSVQALWRPTCWI